MESLLKSETSAPLGEVGLRARRVLRRLGVGRAAAKGESCLSHLRRMVRT